MLITGECFFDAQVPHDDERGAIGKRPIFIRVLMIEVQCAVEQIV